MEAKKFRIGNLVNDNIEITELDSFGINGYYDEGIGGMNYDEYGCLFEDVKPIELNIEWLNKFGFDDSEYKKGYTGVEFRTNMILDFVLTKPKFMGEWQNDYCYDLGQHRFVPIKYVHELQNLFFAITTTELQIKQDVSACG